MKNNAIKVTRKDDLIRIYTLAIKNGNSSSNRFDPPVTILTVLVNFEEENTWDLGLGTPPPKKKKKKKKQ